MLDSPPDPLPSRADVRAAARTGHRRRRDAAWGRPWDGDAFAPGARGAALIKRVGSGTGADDVPLADDAFADHVPDADDVEIDLDAGTRLGVAARDRTGLDRAGLDRAGLDRVWSGQAELDADQLDADQLDADQDDDDHLTDDLRDGAAAGHEADRPADLDVDAPPGRRTPHRRPGTGRVAWRIGSAAAVVLAVIAVMLIVRALAAPGSTEITVKPVPIAASAAASRQSTGTDTASRQDADPSNPASSGSGPVASTAAEDSTGSRAVPSSGVPGATSPASGGVVLVHVAGAVHRPGVVRLPAGSRIADAVAAAGGVLPGAAVDAVNLAARVEDGTQIRVPAAGEQLPGAGSPPPGTGAAASAAPPVTGAGGAPSGAGAGGVPSGSPSAPVNINTADAVGLDALPRVGPVMAQRIVAWRTEHGPFVSVDDLDAVPGIGEKMMAELRPLVTTG